MTRYHTAKWITLATAVLFATAAEEAGGDIVYEFSQENYDALPGALVTMTVDLLFTDLDSADLVIGGGLSSVGVDLLRQPAALASPAELLGIEPNDADFDDTLLGPQFIGPFADEAGVWAFVELGATEGVTGTDEGNGDRRIRVASATVQAGTVIGEVTTFQAVDYHPDLDNTVSFDEPAVAFDPRIQPGQATVTVVPEPTTVLLAAAGALAVCHCRRRSGAVVTKHHRATTRG
ncbi:MAG: hypothetical protein R6X20_03930 [Phycisphaerae bacterium]